MMPDYDQILAQGIRRGAAPGAVAIIVSRDGVIWEGAAGERVLNSGVPMTTDTVGAIYSMTKALTAAAAMQLVEQGRLGLDSPAGDVLPWLQQVQVLEGFDASNRPVVRAPIRPITLRHLLTHTSGFVYERWNQNDARWRQAKGTPAMATRLNRALQVPLAFDPGTRWEYGIGIDWAGKMIEAVSGQLLSDYFAEHLMGPLGMIDTAYVPTPSMRTRLAGLHRRQPDGSFEPIVQAQPSAPEFETGGGGLHSTMRDYGRFIRMILRDGELDGQRLLQAQTVQTMSTNQIGDLRVSLLRSRIPEQSNDAEFFPGEPKSWGLSFQINETACHTGRPAGTLMWAGLVNCFFWIDRHNGIGGAYLSQILPFADERSMGLFYELESAAYAARQAR